MSVTESMFCTFTTNALVNSNEIGFAKLKPNAFGTNTYAYRQTNAHSSNYCSLKANYEQLHLCKGTKASVALSDGEKTNTQQCKNNGPQTIVEKRDRLNSVLTPAGSREKIAKTFHRSTILSFCICL